jgi:glycosyltransferase involved in cell wall biosynthesis
MKRVLLLAFYFPPRNHVASYRTGCFAKYLLENGWQPTVVCEDWPAGSHDSDPDFVGKIPESVEVVRIPAQPYRGAYERLVVRKLMPYVHPERAPIPWWREARKTIDALCARTAFDAVWATSDPLITLGLAAETAERIGKPWIADLRDGFNVTAFGSWYKRPFWARAERELCRKASAVVIVTPRWAETLSKVIGRPVEVLENGFDPALFPQPTHTLLPVFTISYTGTIILPFEKPNFFMQGLRRLLESGAVKPNEIAVNFYGPSADLMEETCPGALATLPVKVHPRLPHRQIIEIQQNSAALLLLSSQGQPGHLPAKLFDYLASRTPILTTPDNGGDVCDIIRKTRAGVIANSPEEIARVLGEWHGEWKKNGRILLPRDEEKIDFYSRRSQARRLAALLDRLTVNS